jgi:two-component system response regulator (stage 0 sporulation protein A)
MVSDLDDEELIKLIREGNVKVSFFLGDKTIDRNIQINSFSKRLGLPEHLEGHKLLTEILRLCLEDDSYLYNMKNKLYKELSIKFNKNYKNIEKCIRYSITICWDNMDYDDREKLFGYSINYNKDKPTTKQFIYTVTNYLKNNLINIDLRDNTRYT